MSAASSNNSKNNKRVNLDRCTNFMRQFRDPESRELTKLSANQFMDVWSHYDKDGNENVASLFSPTVEIQSCTAAASNSFNRPLLAMHQNFHSVSILRRPPPPAVIDLLWLSWPRRELSCYILFNNIPKCNKNWNPPAEIDVCGTSVRFLSIELFVGSYVIVYYTFKRGFARHHSDKTRPFGADV